MGSWLVPRYRPFYDGTTLTHIFNVDPKSIWDDNNSETLF